MTDVFRKEYRELPQLAKDTMLMFKTKAQELMNEFDVACIDLKTDPRCISLAKTNLEQSIMWAVKAIT
jgi:hypothetical protein